MTRKIERREFTAAMALALLGGATITVSGCGGGGGGYGGGGNPAGSTGGGGGDYGPGGNMDPGGGTVGQISANHGHRALVTRAELTSGNDLSLDIQGEAPHTHLVILTAAEVASIRGGARVSKGTTTTEAHQHNVTFN
ncbi:MAG TPA: hypothetical protein VFM88_01680 [Vicinamibacteria bacterium]|nr:hypothetical protein [Vicinamibacteria bacterium]